MKKQEQILSGISGEFLRKAFALAFQNIDSLPEEKIQKKEVYEENEETEEYVNAASELLGHKPSEEEKQSLLKQFYENTRK